MEANVWFLILRAVISFAGVTLCIYNLWLLAKLRRRLNRTLLGDVEENPSVNRGISEVHGEPVLVETATDLGGGKQ